MDQAQKIVDGRRAYFHQMLNIADDDLDPYQYRLLGHYLRVIGEQKLPEYNKTTRETATGAKMSASMVIKTRRQLAEMGWIKMQKVGNEVVIEVVDRMAENVERCATCSPHAQVVHHKNKAFTTCTSCSPQKQSEGEKSPKDIKDSKDDQDQKTPAAVQPHIALIDGYLAALGDRKPIEADPYKRRVRIAVAMVKAGVTVQEIAGYITAVYADSNPDLYWKDKVITLEKVAENLPAFKANGGLNGRTRDSRSGGAGKNGAGTNGRSTGGPGRPASGSAGGPGPITRPEEKPRGDILQQMRDAARAHGVTE